MYNVNDPFQTEAIYHCIRSFYWSCLNCWIPRWPWGDIRDPMVFLSFHRLSDPHQKASCSKMAPLTDVPWSWTAGLWLTIYIYVHLYLKGTEQRTGWTSTINTDCWRVENNVRGSLIFHRWGTFGREEPRFLRNCIFRCNLKKKQTIFIFICPHESVQKWAHKYIQRLLPQSQHHYNIKQPVSPLAECDISLHTGQISMTRLTETDGEATHQTSSWCLSASRKPRAGESSLQHGDGEWESVKTGLLYGNGYCCSCCFRSSRPLKTHSTTEYHNKSLLRTSEADWPGML